MEVTWHSFDFLTGNRGVQVTVRENPTVTQIIGEPTDAAVDVKHYDADLETSPDGSPTEAGVVPGWEAATQPGRTMLVALDENEQPVWGGIVLRRVAVNGSWTTCSLATMESYLDRRFTGTLTFPQKDQATIARELIETAATDGLTLHVNAPASGVVRDRTYRDDDDKTILSVLQELMEVSGGPDFTCGLDWADESRTRLRRVWEVRNRLGVRSSTTSFEHPGSMTGFTFVEDYTDEYGANDVLASSSGEGETRPESDRHVDVLPGWPRFEHRFTPSTSIKRKARLNAHAAARLGVMRDGLTELSFEAHLSSAPLPGRDWHLGDDVYVAITAQRFPSKVGPNGDRVPGFEAWQRVFGYTLDFKADRLKLMTLEA